LSFLNALLGPLFDGLLYPFRDLHPLIGLAFVAFLTAIFILLVFRLTSDQHALSGVKRKLQGSLLEIRLFNDDFRAILSAQSEILKQSLSYLKLSLLPMVWILAPLVLVIAQLQSHYGYQAPNPGETFIVAAQLTEAAALELEGRSPNAVLHSSSRDLQVETAAVWMEGERRLAWRVGLLAPGAYTLTVILDDTQSTKRFDASTRIIRRSPLKVRSGFVDQLLYPAEALLSAKGPIQSISIDLADAELWIPLLGWGIHWVIAFFVLTLVFILTLKGPLKTTI
jgi:uncharacterized membrane protein (DUF106 family)